MRKIFLRGRPGVGKSTVVKRVYEVLSSRGVKVGGIMTLEERIGGRRVGFRVVDLINGRSGWLARVGGGEPRVGKYRVLLQEFEDVGVKALYDALESSCLIVCDEIGPMELKSREFRKIIVKIIEGEKPVLGVIHHRLSGELLQKVEKYGEIIEVTQQNRNRLPDEIAAQLLQELKRLR